MSGINGLFALLVNETIAGLIKTAQFRCYIFIRDLYKADYPPGTLPKPSNAGFVGREWAIEDLAKSEVQQSG